jgi:hypothetical protein
MEDCGLPCEQDCADRAQEVLVAADVQVLNDSCEDSKALMVMSLQVSRWWWRRFTEEQHRGMRHVTQGAAGLCR